jgi:DNA-binding protein
LNLIVVTPDQSEIGTRDLSQNIVQGLTKPELVDVVGIGGSIPLAVAAVDLSRTIANVNIEFVSLDYVPLTATYKPEAIFFELSRNPAEAPSIVGVFEAKSEDEKNVKTIRVSRGDRLDATTNIILWKLSKNDVVKVLASGFAITTAIRSILQVTTSGISKYPVGVSAITTDSIERGEGTGKKVPAIQVYLEKGKATAYSNRHEEVLKQVVVR